MILSFLWQIKVIIQISVGIKSISWCLSGFIYLQVFTGWLLYQSNLNNRLADKHYLVQNCEGKETDL